MKKTKRLISLIVALIVVISSMAMVTITASADENFPTLDKSGAYFEIQTVTVSSTGAVSVPIVIGNNPGIWAANFQVAFDATNLTFNSIDYSASIFSPFPILSSRSDNVITIYAESQKTDSTGNMANVTSDGNVVTLNFTLNDGASYDTFDIGFTKTESDGRKSFINKDSTDLKLTFGNGGVKYLIAKPSTPAISSVALTAKTTAKITWKSVSRASYYYVYTYKGSSCVEKKKVTTTSYSKASLAAGTKYSFKVLAGNDGGSSSLSAAKTITTMNYKSKVTTSLASGKKYLTVKRKTSLAGATGYQIQLSLKKTFKSIAKSANITGTSKKFTSLKSGKVYYARVRAYNTVAGKKVYGAWSAIKYAKVK